MDPSPSARLMPEAFGDPDRYRQQFEAICNNATAGLFILNELQQCTYMNPAAERLTGFALAEVVGRPLHDVVHHSRPDGSPYPHEECPIDRAFPQNNQEQGEETFVHKAGHFYPVAYTASPIREADGIVGTIVEVRDVSEERRGQQERRKAEWERAETNERLQRMVTELQRTEQQLRGETDVVETINRVGQAIAAELDLKTVVQAVTDATTKLTGAQFGAFFYNVTTLHGESYMLYTLSGAPIEAFAKFPMPRNTDVFAPTFRGEGVIRSDDIRQDNRYGKNSPHQGMPDGHLPVVSYLAVPVVSRTGEVLGGLFFGHEKPAVFTQREEQIVVGIANQAAVTIDNVRLYEVAQASRAEKELLLLKEREAREDLETANRMKDEFLATLSHELRTPLNAVLGYATLLQLGAMNAEDQKEGLRAIERNARLQAQLIEDLLDMNRIISGKVRLDVQTIDLPTIIGAALDTVRPSAEAKEIRVQKVIDPLAGPVRGDPGRIQQIVWNLLSNAVKFTAKGGRVQVLLERVNSHVEISVIDTGSGIAPEFLPYVFDRFRQADASTTRRHGGLGLGLSIVKQLTELHGGSVRAKSPGKGEGATFVIALPVTAVHPEAPVERTHPKTWRAGESPCEVSLDDVRVLVVDDEPDACRMVKRILEGCHAEVMTAQSVAAALDLLNARAFDVLVSDIGMPNEDGYDLIRKVRALDTEKGGNLPAVALTAFARSEDRTRAALAGFQTHLPKPVEVSELIAVVANFAGRTGTN